MLGNVFGCRTKVYILLWGPLPEKYSKQHCSGHPQGKIELTAEKISRKFKGMVVIDSKHRPLTKLKRLLCHS